MASIIALSGWCAAPQPAKTQSLAPTETSARSRSLVGKTKWIAPLRPLLMPQRSTDGLSGSMLAPRTLSTERAESMRKTQRQVSSSGSTIQGHLKASSSADFPNGWWDVDVNGEVKQLWGSTALMGSCGFVRNGRICQFTTINSYGYYWFYYSEYDINTGEQLYETELADNDGRNYVINCAYDEAEDKVYLQTYNQVLSGMAWSSFNPETQERDYLNNSVDWDDNRVVASGWNPRDGKLYGITEDARFVNLDKASGKATTVAQLPVSIYTYSQSMAFSPLDHGFVWAAMYADNTSGFAVIDPATGTYTAKGLMAAQNEFVQLYCPNADFADTTPDVPGVEIGFDKAALTGKVSITLPSTTFGGDALGENASLTAVVSLDGNEYATVSGKAGENVETNVTTTQGLHKLEVAVRFGAETGPARELEFYAGHDTPNAPSNVRINTENSTISWNAPEGGVHGGYIDASAVRYNVYLGDRLVNSAPTENLSVEFTAPTSLGIYVPRVEAMANGLTSEKGEGEGVKYGEIFDMPFHITPTEAEGELCTIVDANNDGSTWVCWGERQKFYYYAPMSGIGDDWLFFPKAHFTSGENLYLITMDLWSLLATRYENLEVWLSTSTNPADAFLKVADFDKYNKDTHHIEKVKFAITEAGDYHVAFHTAPTDGWMINLENITVEMTEDTKQAPADLKGVEITGGENGALEAIITFYAPTKSISGAALDPSKEITVHATSDAGTSSVKVLPGQQATFTVPTFQGTNTIWLVPQNEGGYGLEKSFTVFTGVEKPGPVTNVSYSISDDGLSMTLSWDAPVIGENGGYINPDEVKYQIYTAGDEMWMFHKDIGSERTYTYTIPAGSQSLVQVAIAGYNVAGTASTANFKGASRIMGTPHELPFTETFTWGYPDHLPILIVKPTALHTANWTLNDPTAYEYNALSPDYGAMICQPTASGESLGRAEFPIVSTLGYNNATFRLDIYHFASGGYARVLAKTGDDTQYTTIGEVDTSKGKGYTNELFRLPERFQNRPWVAFAIEAEFNSSSTDRYVIIDNYHVIDLPDNDIMAVITDGPTAVTAGETALYSAVAYNNGKNTLTYNGLWEVLDGDKVIASQSVVGSPLEPEETEDTDFSFTPTPNLAEAALTVRFTVIPSKDDSPANNVYTASLFVRSDGKPAVTDLTGLYNEADKAAELTWTAPATGMLSTETFETLTDGSYTGELGAWTNLDLDGKDVCFIANSTLVDAGQPKAWQVISTLTANLGAFAANSGNQFLMAITPLDGSAANDWLISPLVQGASLVEITANILSSEYPETFEVYYSEGSADVDDFVLLQRVTKETYGWEVIPVRLPAQARRFAIRYCSIDQFGMMLDDIAYVPANSDSRFTVTGYNIYRDGEKIASDVAALAYADLTLAEETTASYFVTAVTTDGEGGRSNTVAVSAPLGTADALGLRQAIRAEAGGLVLMGFDSQRYVVSTPDGRVASAGVAVGDAHHIALPSGLYIIKAGSRSAKAVVK